jgi:predicted RNA binding protein YcfA (HicA-like mRNA interferase family)
MSQLPSITGSERIKVLSENEIGFGGTRIQGSHQRLEQRDGRQTTLPVHRKETPGPGPLLKILRDADRSRADLLDLL